MRRRGFTLVELLVALVLLVAVAGVLYMLMTRTQRTSQAQSEWVVAQSSVRNAAWIVPGELREIGGSGSGASAVSDIAAMSDTSIRYRAMRGTGITCSIAAAEVRVYADPGAPALAFAGVRDPQAGRDSLLLFDEGPDDRRSDDDRWVPLGIAGVDPGSSCGPRRAIAFTLATAGNPMPGSYPVADFRVGAPVRTFEAMGLELYQTSGQWWLGARSVSAGESVQPVLGPLQPRGFQMVFRDSVGNVTAVAARVRTIDLTFRSVGTRAAHLTADGGIGPVRDSLVTRVRLRNVPL